jgi:hypothetical protein
MSFSSGPSGLRRFLTAAVAAALIGAGAFGAKTLWATPASVCDDPIAICAIGQSQCEFCCAQQQQLGTCDFGPCICFE